MSLLWTEAQKRKVPIGTILQWTSQKTASHAGLADRKGKIAAGYDGDLIIWDPDAEYIVRTHLSSHHPSDQRVQVTKDSLRFKNKVTPYEGMVLSGRVERTVLRSKLLGELIYKGFADKFEGLEPSGVLLNLGD